MNVVILILMSILFISCSSLSKGTPERYFKVKKYTEIGVLADNFVKYTLASDGTDHCFKDVDDREIVTVHHTHELAAIDHFHKRTTKVDIKVRQTRSHILYDIKSVTSTTFELEMASCQMQILYGYINIDSLPYFTSFRLAK
jgi:hypothetical protein